MDFWVIFLTGLTTGGLTCLAVQGGLLATAIVRPVSITPSAPSKGKKKTQPAPAQTGVQLPKDPLPILVFLGTKLAAYTLVGFLLGALGSAFRITPPVQAVMQFIVGMFMVVTALNLLNVHPFFRRFTIQPPKFLTRYIRNRAKQGDVFAPAILGALTIFIPCGTTQAMMVLALSTRDALLSALVMFVFVLGTSPTFFILGYAATRLRGKVATIAVAAAAILILFMGLASIDGGLNLLGSPLAPSQIIAGILGQNSAPAASGEISAGVQELRIVADGRGYTPNVFAAAPDQPIRLRMVTQENYSCSSVFVIPALGIEKVLPVTGETVIDLPAQPAGQLRFSCGMGMYTGVIRIG